MIKTFRDRRTRALYETGRSTRFSPDVIRSAMRRLRYLDIATHIDMLRAPAGNRLHKLKGDRQGYYAIAVNDQWRICFRFEEGDAYDVEITDYH